MINLLRLRPWIGSPSSTEAESQSDLDSLFEELVDAQYKRIFSLIFRMVRSEQDAADLTQETFVRVYRALPRVRARGALPTWVRRIATNLCLDHLRRRISAPPQTSLDGPSSFDPDTQATLDVVDTSGEPDRLYFTAESKRLLYAAIDTLPTGYRTVILLHHIEGMRVEEIAEAMRVPGGTIKSRLSRARRELRRKLLPYYD